MAEKKESAEAAVRTIRRVTRKKYSAEEKVRIVLEGLRGETSIAALCPAGGDPVEPVLPMEQGLPRGRQAAPGGGHRAPGGHTPGDRDAGGA